MSKTTPMTPDAAARIQRANALNNDGKVNVGTFPAWAQKAVAKQQTKKPN